MNRIRTIGKNLSLPRKVIPYGGRGLIILAVGILLFGWLLNTPAGLLGKADAVGYAVCHRIDARSYHLGIRQTPLCARCSGMYLGAMLGLAYQAVASRKRAGMPPLRVWIFFGLFVLAFALDGMNSYLHLFPGAPSLYEPFNTLRLVTGTGMGLAIAGAIFPAFNQTVWENWDRSPAIPGLKPLSLMIILALGLDWMVATENIWLLYPLALISAAGVLVLLTIVYTMMWLMILRMENRFQRISQLGLPALGGFGMALLQIVILDLARFALTGSWEGFLLG